MNMNIDKEKVKTLRLTKSWSQEKLAEEGNLNLRTIQRIEKDGVASLQSCTFLAKALGVEPIELNLESSKQINFQAPPYDPNIPTALLINSIVFILWGISQIITSTFSLSNNQESAISFLFLFFAGLILLAFLTPIAKRRFISIFGCCIIAMLLTPANPWITILFSLLLWALFEVSLLLAKHFKTPEHVIKVP